VTSKPGLVCIGEGLYELGLDERGSLDEAAAGPREGFGGDAANTAVMAAALGAPSRLIGRVGDDALGRRLVAFWRQSGVDVSTVVVDAGAPTGIYVNAVDAGGAHSFDYHRSGSAGSRLSSADLTAGSLAGCALAHYTGVSLSISATAVEACLELARRARAAGARVSFAANVRTRLSPRLDLLRVAASTADIVFCSEEDARLLYGSVDAAVDQLTGRVDELVLTRGSANASVYANGIEAGAVPPVVAAVDAAGAGDALAGAYLSARLRGDSVERALQVGVTAAALSCRSHGCGLSYPSAAGVAEALHAAHPTLKGA
jgi:2-dehydro-3-deoxygluconokinase